MKKIDLNDFVVKSIKNYVKENFTQPPKDFFKDIIESCDDILECNSINIDKVMKDNSTDKSNRVTHLLNKNKIRIDEDNCIVPSLAEEIIKLLILYKNRHIINNKRSTRSFIYKDAIDDVYESYIIPEDKTNIMSVKLNLFYDPDVKYSFKEAKAKKLDVSISTLQTLNIKINGIIEQNILPIRWKVICTERNNYGVECGNTVTFCEAHLHGKIKCTDDMPENKDGHIIKKPEKALIESSAILYTYEGNDLLERDSKEIIICSLVPIKSNSIICNSVFVNDGSSSYVLVLSIKKHKEKELDKPILAKSPTSLNFLDDIYKSIQGYLSTYHNIKLTNQNRYIGHVIIFMILNNIFFNQRMNSLIVGKSGSGKSVWAELLIPLFTFNYKIIMGTDITRNKLIGGKSNAVSSSSNSLFSPGYVATQDILFAEECTNSLKDFKDVKLNQNNNIFHLIKSSSGREIDVAIQGGQKVYPRSSNILVGNLEQLDFTSKYKYYVASKYKKLSDNVYKESFPLFKPIEYYSETLKDEALAKAHAIVRQSYRDVSGNHYITRLPPAEQARYTFFIALEDDLDNRKSKREMKKEVFLNNPKREILINELSEIFFNKPIPYGLKKEINNFYNDEFYESRNNYKRIFGIDKAINVHIENNIVTIMEQLVWMNRLYNNSFPKSLTQEEKDMINLFLLYNYNTLSNKEASMITRPFVNDYYTVENALDSNIESINQWKQNLEREKIKDEIEMENLLDDN